MFDTVTLSNGVKVTMEPISAIRSVAFGIWVKNGSRNESAADSGISHFIEHMLFKGTAKRSAKDIADEFDAIGGQLNAYTAKEMTCYYARVLDTHFDAALDVLSDMFFNSKFDDAEIAKERNVILEEINMTEDAPEDLVTETLTRALFPDDALGMPILGEEKTISAFDHSRFVSYFTNNYVPQNTVIAVAGNFKTDEVLKKIEARFGGKWGGEHYVPAVYDAVYKPCFATVEKDVEQLHVCLAYQGVKVDDPAMYDMNVLNALFGGGMSSRLFQNIREKHGLVYTVYSYNAFYLDTGVFTIYAAMQPGQAQKAVGLIREEIQNLYTDRITKELLDRTKEQIKSNLLLSLESSSSRMSAIGRNILLLGRNLSTDEYIRRIDAVSLDSLYALTERIFDKNRPGAALVGKVEGITREGLLGL